MPKRGSSPISKSPKKSKGEVESTLSIQQRINLPSSNGESTLEFATQPDWSFGDEWVLIGTKQSFKDFNIESALQIKDDKYKEILRESLEGLSSSKENGDSARLYLPNVHNKNKLVKVTLIELNNGSSRHNAPSRPDQLVSIGRRVFPKNGKVSVGIIVENEENCYPLACALARCLPLYSRKNLAISEEKTINKLSILTGFVLSSQKQVSAEEIKKISVVTDGIRKCAKLVDTPTSELTTTHFISHVQNVVKELKDEKGKEGDVSIKVIQGKELEKEGLGGLYGVGKAAVDGPALVILSYSPNKKSEGETKNICLVGKGIVYDTGGLSIKISGAMLGMKRDMAGAASIFYSFVSLVRSKSIHHNLYALLCLAENAVGPQSTRPDDILYMYSGKTVEVNNTDAEGRLVLGDGVAYATKNFKPDLLLDMATLTGAQLISTGKRHAGFVCNDDEFEANLLLSGKKSGDLLFPLPYCPEFFNSEFSSDVADMKNSVKDRANAQSACAAQFIANHLVDYDGPWLHVDMAGPAHDGERATGYGVALLHHFVSSIFKQ